jgi:hypothetical protein
MHENDSEGAFVTEIAWEQICRRARLFCPLCGEHPSLDDVEDFADAGYCSYCSAKFQQWMQD